MTSKRKPKWITDPAAIQRVFATIGEGAEVEIKFKPIDDPVWRSGTKEIVDAEAAFLSSQLLTRVVDNTPWTGALAEPQAQAGGLRLRLDTTDLVAPRHVLGMRVLHDPKTDEKVLRLDSLRGYVIRMRTDGHVVVGCQKFTPDDVLTFFKVLAGFLGYDLED